MSWSHRLAGLAFVAAGVFACGEGTTTPPALVPTTLLLSTNAVTFNALGANQQISATVRDQNGDPMAGLTATFVSADPAVATVSAGGLITAVANGTTTVAVSHGTIPSQQIAVGVSQVVAEVVKTAGDGQTGLVGGQLTTAVEVEIRDARGNPVPGGVVPNTTVQFVAGGGGSVGSGTVMAAANGRASTTWTLGPGVGPQALTASIQGGSASAVFTATAAQATAPAIVKVDGDLQFGLVGAPVNVPPTVMVQDEFGAAVSGAPVTFTVTGGGGSVAGGSVTTDAQGIARPTSWTLGGPAGANTVEVTSGTLPPVTFTATGETAAYDIVITYQSGTNPTPAQQAVFDNAVAMWESIIYRDLADVSVNADASACGIGVVNKTIDDIEVFVTFANIDGAGGILAQAGRCDSDPPTLRAANGLPVLGVLTLDNADLAILEGNGTLQITVTHELGHALGFDDRMFAFKGRLQNPSRPSSPGVDTHFNGPRAIAEMNAAGGSGYVGAKVPLENSAIQGQADSHWREVVFDEELMTPFIEAAAVPMPFSRVTGAALLDMGYGVNLSAAQAFALGAPPGAGARPRSGKVALVGDAVFYRLEASASRAGR